MSTWWRRSAEVNSWWPATKASKRSTSGSGTAIISPDRPSAGSSAQGGASSGSRVDRLVSGDLDVAAWLGPEQRPVPDDDVLLRDPALEHVANAVSRGLVVEPQKHEPHSFRLGHRLQPPTIRRRINGV